MDTNQIMKADFLDLVFDNRNKMYGAYELRRTYEQRIKKSLLFTGLIFGLAITAAAISANSHGNNGKVNVKEVTLSTLDQDKKKVEEIKQPEKKTEPVVKTEKFVAPEIAPDDKVPDPPPSMDELGNARIDNFTQDGVDPGDIDPGPKDPGGETGVVDARPVVEEDIIFNEVQVPAHFEGNWRAYLERTINANVAVDNGAAPGQYTVIIRFVVDKEGNISDLTPMTNIGYGMEEEAMRVLRDKKSHWEPGIQNGVKVKSYHKQPITFVVSDDN